MKKVQINKVKKGGIIRLPSGNCYTKAHYNQVKKSFTCFSLDKNFYIEIPHKMLVEVL